MKKLFLLLIFLAAFSTESSAGTDQTWYVLVPFSSMPIEQAVQMPLSKWDQYQSARTATSCEAFRTFLQIYAEKHINTDWYLKERRFIEQHHVSNEAIAYSRCVSIDDPRLIK